LGTLIYGKQDLEMDVYFRRAPILGNMDGRFFLRDYLLEEILLGFLEMCKSPVDEYFSP